jgi:hypothetical protein
MTAASIARPPARTGAFLFFSFHRLCAFKLDTATDDQDMVRQSSNARVDEFRVSNVLFGTKREREKTWLFEGKHARLEVVLPFTSKETRRHDRNCDIHDEFKKSKGLRSKSVQLKTSDRP